MKNQKKERDENWEDEFRPKSNKGKKSMHNIHNSMQDKKIKLIKKKPKYKNDWLNFDEE